MPPRPHERPAGPLESGAGRKVLPFALVMLVSYVSLDPAARSDHRTSLALTHVLGAVVVAAALVVPWRRLPLWCQSAPAFAVFGLVVLLRHAAGGSASGVGVLVLLPVTWLALYGRRAEVLLSLLCTAATFLVPLVVVGAPSYGSVDLRKTLVVTAVAALVALVVNRSVLDLEAGKRRAEELAAALAVSEAHLAAVSAAGRELRSRNDVRPAVVQAAGRIADAPLTMLMEPDGHGSLTQTAAIGFDTLPLHIPLKATSSGSVRAFVSGHRVFAPDAQHDVRISTAIARASGVRSAVFLPLLSGGAPVGVLMVGWREPVTEDDPRVAALRAYAVEATDALHRADDLQVLRRAATEDPLTGASNRGSLDVILATELPVDGDAQRAVLMVDLDHFKDYNDEHGHAAGDRLLKEAVAAWRGQLRDDDLLARYGGEEFCIVLRGCPPAEVGAVADRIRLATPGGRTVSIGSARARPLESPGELLLRADRALYLAKRTGRDRVVDADADADVDPGVPVALVPRLPAPRPA